LIEFQDIFANKKTPEFGSGVKLQFKAVFCVAFLICSSYRCDQNWGCYYKTINNLLILT